jgi:type VI secretion system secreted protein VgrG
VVENNDTLKVGFDKKDKGDQTIEIFNDQTITIGNDAAATGHRTTTLLLGNEVLTVKKGTRTVTLDVGDDTHQLKKGNRKVLVDEGNDTHTITKGNREVSIDTGNDTLTVKSGDQTITVTAGKVTMEAGTSIELKVGSNTLKITQSEIAINGIAISATATGEFKADGAAGAKLTSSAIVTVQGSLVKIN